jgi:hypothetical protein
MTAPYEDSSPWKSRLGTAEGLAAIRFAVMSPRRRVWQATIGSVIEQPDECLLDLGRRLVTEDPSSHRFESVLRALAAMERPDAWRIIEWAAECEDDVNSAKAKALLGSRGATV